MAHHFDIRVLAQRGTVYLSLLILVTGLYFCLVFLLSAWFRQVFGREDIVFLAIGLLTTCASVASIPFLERRLHRGTDGFFLERPRQQTTELIQLQEQQNQIMADISHRLQTPLAIIKSELNLLKRQPDPPEHLEAFERSIDDISTFIYDLLKLAKLGTKEKGSSKERVNLTVLLRDLVECFEVIATDRAVAFSARLEEGISLIANRDDLEELVMNLVSNAFKYLKPDGDKEVSIVLRKAVGWAVLEIIDNGRGIIAEDLERIFERFYRGRQPGAARGTGLGLAIAKRIVENHRGEISIQSQPGQGTKATVLLPLREFGSG